MSNARELAELGGSYGTGGSSGLKNRIINGAMVIDQRNAGTSVTVTSGSLIYPVDRFFAFQNTGSSSFTVQRSTTAPVGFSNSLLWTTTTGVSASSSQQARITQRIEGFNAADLAWGTANAAAITISFKARASITGTFAVAVVNSAGNRSYVSSFTINSANTFEEKTISLAGDTSGTWLTDNSTGLQLVFDIGSGSNFNATVNTWSAGEYFRLSGSANVIGTTGATFYITGVQLEKGSTATSFDYRPYGTELALCQRYYETSTVYVISNTTAYTPFVFPYTTKRAAPTVTASGMPSVISGSNSGINNYSGYFNLSALGSAIVTATVSAEL